MFVVLVGSVFTTFVLLATLIAGAADTRASRSSSRSGSGSRCCSRTSPRRWPKAGARRRPTRCGRRARGRPQAKRARGRSGYRRRAKLVPSQRARSGDLVLCMPGDIIPGDGEVIEGVASVDESAITGESAPVIRESGGDRSAVTGGTKVLSD